MNHRVWNTKHGTVAFLVFVVLALFSTPAAYASDLVLIHAKIYPSPTDPPLTNASILIHDGQIQSIGPDASTKIPPHTQILDCKGLTIVAGFWNSHVHILTPGLLHAENLSAAQLTTQLQDMLTRWGFTTVFDIASVLANTKLIRQRIASGEVLGPRIFTVGEPLWGKDGTPIYVKNFLQANHINIPGVESPAQATERVRQEIHDGADGVKLFVGSVQAHGILIMPLDLAKAAVTEAHKEGKPVFAHPSNQEGVEVALQSGVDILAHTTPSDGPWPPDLIQRLKAANMALIPTLTLWHFESRNISMEELEKDLNAAVLPELRAYSEAGGQILFGTDVGYITQFDTTEELHWMSRAGLTWQQILATLTTNPAQRFNQSTHSGRIAKGMDADIVVLNDDPATEPTAFAKVRYTIRAGKLLYSQPGAAPPNRAHELH